MKHQKGRFLTFLAYCAVAGGTLSPAWGGYERAVDWGVLGEFDPKSVLRSQYGSPQNRLDREVSEATISAALADSQNRVGRDFKIPMAFRDEVNFWLRVYTQYTTQHAVIHDERHLGIVYEVLDFRKIAREAKSTAEYVRGYRREIGKAMRKYRHAFAKLRANPRPKHPDAAQEAILSALRKAPHPHSMADYAENLHAQLGQRDSVVKGLIAAEPFFGKMELIFSQMGVPVELTRIALVESTFDLRALSKVGALGVWQFMPASGRQYLKMDKRHHIDERLSPFKATVAAAKLLKWNYRYLGDWTLAVVAYNHGAGGLPRPRKAMQLARLQKLFTACAGRAGAKPQLGWASRNYYSEFLAVLHAEAYRDQFFGETPGPHVRPVAFEQVKTRQSALNLAMTKGVSIHEFRLFNPDIQDVNRPIPHGFWVAIPADRDDLRGLMKSAGLKDLAALTVSRDR